MTKRQVPILKAKKAEDRIFTIPNILSIIRILFIPIYSYIYVVKQKFFVAAVLIAVSMATDAFDGIIARKCNMITTFGKVLDPIADKLTQATIFYCLSTRWWDQLKWVVVIFVAKETFMLVMGIFNLKKGRMLDGAHIAGKICTTVLFVSMGLLVINPNMADRHVGILAVLCCIAMFYSFGSYLAAYLGRGHGVEIVSLRKDEVK